MERAALLGHRKLVIDMALLGHRILYLITSVGFCTLATRIPADSYRKNYSMI